MSRSAKLFFATAPLVIVDMFLAVISFLLAYGIRYSGSGLSLASFRTEETFAPYEAIILLSPFIRVFSQNVFGVYQEKRKAGQISANLLALLKSVTLGTAIIVILAFAHRGVFAFRDFSYSRFVFAMDWLLNLFGVAAVHSLVWMLRDELRRRGVGLRRLAVQGVGETSRGLLVELDRFPESGYSVVGYVANDVDQPTVAIGDREFKWLGGTSNILALINDHKLDEIVVTNVASLNMELPAFVEECHKRDVVVKLIPDFYGILLQGKPVEELAGQPAIQINEIAIVGGDRILKRIEDIALSTVGLIFAAPFLLLTTLLIKLDSPGPVLFTQRRAGKNGRVFNMIKFRSMYQDAEARRKELEGLNEADGMLFKMKGDPRITRIGRIIRKTSIDELPQLFNILRGDMSLVGPRPLPASDIERTNAWEHRRLSVPPGLTGLWQVNRQTHSAEEMLKWDVYYVENWSLWLDFTILLKTVAVVLLGKGAY